MHPAEEIRSLVMEGKLEDGLRCAMSFLQERDRALYDLCLQHQGRLKESSREFELDVISHESLQMTRAKARLALVEVVAKRVEELSNQRPAAPQQASPPPPSAFQGTVPVAQAQAAPSAGSMADHGAALRLVQSLFELMAANGPENAARLAAVLLHRSLLNGDGSLQPAFKQHNFGLAHQRLRQYRNPVHFEQTKSTQRTAIGSLRDRDEGEEYVYTLGKLDDSGGMPGMVRVFFLKNGGEPKITALSL